MGGITTTTKIIGIPRMIGMTGEWKVKRTMMTEMRRITGITTIMDKSPWESNAIIIFLSGFPNKTGHPFLNFLVVAPPPLTLYKVATLKNICPSNFFCGVRGVIGPV